MFHSQLFQSISCSCCKSSRKHVQSVPYNSFPVSHTAQNYLRLCSVDRRHTDLHPNCQSFKRGAQFHEQKISSRDSLRFQSFQCSASSVLKLHLFVSSRRSYTSSEKKEHGELIKDTLKGGREPLNIPASDIYTIGSKKMTFQSIDEITSREKEAAHNALVNAEEELHWKHKMMFKYQFTRTPKHLTWAQLGREVECLECHIELDTHRPEEIFLLKFYYKDLKTKNRDLIFSATNNVAYSEGLTDLLAAIGSCLSRGSVYRTIRFDDGLGTYREINLQKAARYTSDVLITFRAPVKYELYPRLEEEAQKKLESSQNENNEFSMKLTGSENDTDRELPPSLQDRSMHGDIIEPPHPTWGFHPTLMEPEYITDQNDAPGTYHITLSAHALSCALIRALERLIIRPLKDFYRPSQVVRTAMITDEEEVGVMHAFRGWLGLEERRYPHFTPLEAIQSHFLGDEAPFHLTAIIVRLRQLTLLTNKNPENMSWLSVRIRDSALALRNTRAKLLGAGPSSLFLPTAFHPTINQMLPKPQRRKLRTRFSAAGFLGYNDETKRLDHVASLDLPLQSPEKANNSVPELTNASPENGNSSKS